MEIFTTNLQHVQVVYEKLEMKKKHLMRMCEIVVCSLARPVVSINKQISAHHIDDNFIIKHARENRSTKENFRSNSSHFLVCVARTVINGQHSSSSRYIINSFRQRNT